MTKKINLLFEYLLFILIFALALVLTLSDNYQSTTLDGVKLWLACVFPSLFPYLFITAIISSLSVSKRLASLLSPVSRKIFRVNGTLSYALFLSLISGYPIGAKMVSDLKEQGLISQAESVRASILCSNSSPAFLIGSIGSITFNDRSFGITLFCLHILSTLINGFIFSFYKHKDKPTNPSNAYPKPKADNLLYDGVYSSVISVLVVGGLITVFYILTEILEKTGVLSPIIYLLSTVTDEQTAKAVVFGCFECTRGLKQLSLGLNSNLTLPIALATCGFGGLSVIMQSLAFLKKAKIKTAPFLLSKVTSAVIGFILGILFNLVF